MPDIYQMLRLRHWLMCQCPFDAPMFFGLLRRFQLSRETRRRRRPSRSFRESLGAITVRFGASWTDPILNDFMHTMRTVGLMAAQGFGAQAF